MIINQSVEPTYIHSNSCITPADSWVASVTGVRSEMSFNTDKMWANCATASMYQQGNTCICNVLYDKYISQKKKNGA